MHIPDDPLFFEKFYFTPGDLGFRDFDTTFGRIAPLLCWDQWYPEAARLASLDGREYFLLSHGHRLASGGEPPKIDFIVLLSDRTIPAHSGGVGYGSRRRFLRTFAGFLFALQSRHLPTRHAVAFSH